MQISVSEELKKNAKWRLGDVVSDPAFDWICLVAKDNNGKFITMGLDEENPDSYSTQYEKNVVLSMR